MKLCFHVDRFVSGAKERWLSLDYTDQQSTAVLSGMAGETVIVMAIAPGSNTVMFHPCLIGSAGTARFSATTEPSKHIACE